MGELLLIAAYVLPLIMIANLAVSHKRLSPLLALLTIGFVKFSGLWQLCEAAVKRLSFAEASAFDPKSPVHKTAAFLMILGFLLLVGITATDELASEDAASAISLPEALLELVGTGALHLASALLGVGWLIRRRFPDVLRRLCLRKPTLRELGISIAAGIGLWLLSTAAVAIWEQALPADIFQQQTEAPRLYFQAFSGSAITALLLALIPAMSEEIFYRGALQPVFGVLLSSLFFTATHLQYAFTPAVLILFAVSLGFAWLRTRFHTSAAIFAHALYNFLPFLFG